MQQSVTSSHEVQTVSPSTPQTPLQMDLHVTAPPQPQRAQTVLILVLLPFALLGLIIIVGFSMYSCSSAVTPSLSEIEIEVANAVAEELGVAPAEVNVTIYGDEAILDDEDRITNRMTIEVSNVRSMHTDRLPVKHLLLECSGLDMDTMEVARMHGSCLIPADQMAFRLEELMEGSLAGTSFKPVVAGVDERGIHLGIASLEGEDEDHFYVRMMPRAYNHGSLHMMELEITEITEIINGETNPTPQEDFEKIDGFLTPPLEGISSTAEITETICTHQGIELQFVDDYHRFGARSKTHDTHTERSA